MNSQDEVRWVKDTTSDDWDRALADLGGHPLQSALWGDARRAVDGIHDHRWMMLERDVPQFMIRFEERAMPGLGKLAWVPRGPSGRIEGADSAFPAPLLKDLKKSGFTLLVTDEWRSRPECEPPQESFLFSFKTSWIDTSRGQDAVWKDFDSQFRQGIRRGQREALVVNVATLRDDVREFHELCKEISRTKGFHLPASLPLFEYLLQNGRQGRVEARLFVVRHNNKLAAGAFVIRCGGSAHFFWGATDRESSKERVGEAVHWAAIQWAIASGCRLYDLEGLDPEGNKSVYAFKKKMGGKEVTLAGKMFHPLAARGRLAAWLQRQWR